MATCPNKAHPDYKVLEARYGKKGAIKKYIENGYDIPVPENVSKRSVFSRLGIKFNSRDTMQALNDNPEVAKDIIDSLEKLMPDVIIYKDGLFDKDGNWRAIEPGEKGMHYRNAFQGAVAWANDAFLETPPHEYAHEYIDMFRNTPVVKRGIKKYGEEQLVKRMGAYYAGRKMSNSFQKFVQDFWSTIKSLMGSSDVADVLSSHFYKGKKLDGPIHKGTEIFSFQESNKPFKRTNGGINSDGRYDNIKKPAESINDDVAIQKLLNDLERVDAYDSENKDFNYRKLERYLSELTHKLKRTDTVRDGKGFSYKNTAALDKRLLDDMLNEFNNDVDLKKLGEALINSGLVSTEKVKRKGVKKRTQQEALDVIGEIVEEGKAFGEPVNITNKYGKTESVYKGNGLTLERQSNMVSRIFGKARAANKNMKMGAAVGNFVDIVARDIFSGAVKTLQEYITEANIQNKENGYKLDIGQAQFKQLTDTINKVKSELESKGWEFVSEDVFVYTKYTKAEKEATGFDGVGGTLDLVGIDKNGKMHIVDFKNVKLTNENQEKTANNIFGNTWGKVKDWANQQSVYSETTEKEHGLEIESTNILAISPRYEENEDLIDVKSFELTAGTEGIIGIDNKFKSPASDNLIQLEEGAVLSQFKDKIDENIEPQEGVVNFSKKQNEAYQTLLRIVKSIDYITRYKNSMADGNGNLVASEPIIKNIKDSIDNTKERRDNIYSKVKNKRLKQLLKWTERIVAQWQNGLRTTSTFLSGGENTELSDLVYKALDQAGVTYEEIKQDFSDALISIEKIPGYNKWSLFNKQDSNIDQLETIEISVKGKEGSIQVTKAEAITLYLNLRQKTSNSTINQHGFILDDTVEGRNIKFNSEFQFSANESQKFMKEMEADSEIMGVIEKVDAALEVMYEATNKTFKQENGYDLPKHDFYFPIYSGKKTLGERISKNTISDFRAGHAQLGQSEPLRIGDVMKVMTNVKNSGSLYAAYSIPIENAKKLIEALRSEYKDEQEEVYFDAMEGTLKFIEDSSNLFSNQGAKKFSKAVNMLTSNFAVSVLAMNLAVMAKQPVSYITAMEVIDKKFLKQVGWGIGGFVGINFTDIMKSLTYTGVAGGETLLSVEWKMDTSNPIYIEMINHSPKMRARLEGMISREAGEALMNAEIGKDKIKMPWKKKNGDSVYVSKARLMEGIKIFDSATIMSLWKAAKLEAAEYHPELNANAEEGTAEYNEYWEHIEGRVNEIVNKTQPTYDAANSSGLSQMKDPIARVFSMFSSARQKVAMLMIEGTVKYVNNPTAENKQKLMKRSLNVMVTTAATLAFIDMLKGFALYGMEDDDDIASFITFSMINNNMSYIYGVGNLVSLITSQMDDKPWHKNMQHPVEGAVQELSEALSHIFKGNFDKAFFKSLDVTMKSMGLPLSAKTYAKAAVRLASSEEE